VKQLLAVAADIDGDRLALAPGRFRECKAERQRGLVSELGELQLLLLLLEGL